MFIVSGGLAEAVKELGKFPGVHASNIHAVEVEFNQLPGRWWEYWNHIKRLNPDECYLSYIRGALTEADGKAVIIHRLRRRFSGRALMVGDGVSDLEGREAVDLFCGFGAVAVRQRVAAQADVFITADSLSPELPLTLGSASIPPSFQATYERGVKMIRDGEVRFKDASLRETLLPELDQPAGRHGT